MRRSGQNEISRRGRKKFNKRRFEQALRRFNYTYCQPAELGVFQLPQRTLMAFNNMVP